MRTPTAADGQPAEPGKVRGVLRLAGLGASVPVVLVLVFGVGFLARIEGSGWCTYQTRYQRLTLRNMYFLAKAVLEFQSDHGYYPPGPLATNAAGRLVQGGGSSCEGLDSPESTPATDGWGQPLGYRLSGTRFLIWSTGLEGGDPGPEPDWINPFDENSNGWMFATFWEGDKASLGCDVVLVGGTFTLRRGRDGAKVSNYDHSSLFVQYPCEVAEDLPEGPFNLGHLFGTTMFRLFGPT